MSHQWKHWLQNRGLDTKTKRRWNRRQTSSDQKAAKVSVLDTYTFLPRGRREDFASEITSLVLSASDVYGVQIPPASWDAFDVGMIHSHQGIAFDGRYIYFPPGYEGSAGYTAIKED